MQTRPSQTKLTIRISGGLLDSFLEMARAKTMNPEECAAQCVESEIAAFRALRVRPSLVAGFSKDKSPFVTKKTRRYVQLTEDQISEAVRLYEEEALTIQQIAKRFSKSATRMGELLRKHGCNVQRNV